MSRRVKRRRWVDRPRVPQGDGALKNPTRPRQRGHLPAPMVSRLASFLRRVGTSRGRQAAPLTKEEKKDLVERLAAYTFVAGLVAALVGAGVSAATGSLQPVARTFTTALWAMFATMHANIFYKGEFKWKHGPTYTREHSPWEFYQSVIFGTIGSMSIATFLLWKAWFGD